jgi:hypothetical protein
LAERPEAERLANRDQKREATLGISPVAGGDLSKSAGFKATLGGASPLSGKNWEWLGACEPLIYKRGKRCRIRKGTDDDESHGPQTRARSPHGWRCLSLSWRAPMREPEEEKVPGIPLPGLTMDQLLDLEEDPTRRERV